jgi:type IV pilus assembly protein PilW
MIERSNLRIPQQRSSGMTLIELMVALAIGSFLMIGAITVFMQSRNTFRVNESVSRLQENARFVLDALEPDVRMAHYFGLTTRSGKVQGRALPTDPAAFAVANDCGVNWSVNLASEVDASNNAYAWACAAFGAAQAGSDTLVIRRVMEDPEPAPQNNTLYVQSARFQDSQIFVGPAIPAAYIPATSQTHQLVVDGYYVSANSTLDTPGNPIPSLRMKTLVGGAGGLRVIDQEVLPGVEDMQIEFGVDTDVLDAANRGSVDRYVNPGDPILDPLNAAFIPSAQILSVRVWLRLRTEHIETGFTDTVNYVYADRNVGPFNDPFRRVLVSKTIYLRNARPAR